MSKEARGVKIMLVSFEDNLNTFFSIQMYVFLQIQFYKYSASMLSVFLKDIVSVNIYNLLVSCFLFLLFARLKIFVAVSVEQVTFQILQNKSKRYYSHKPEVFICCNCPVINQTRLTVSRGQETCENSYSKSRE